MEKMIAGLCALLMFPASAFANDSQRVLATDETQTAGAALLAGKLADLQNGKAVSVADLQQATGDRQSLPQNGEATLNPIFHTQVAHSPYSRPSYDTTTTSSFKIALKIVDGKIVGMAATESVTLFQNGGSITPEAFASFSFGDADFVKKHQSPAESGAAKGGPKFIPSETKTPTIAPSPLQEQACANVVSPSSPGCR